MAIDSDTYGDDGVRNRHNEVYLPSREIEVPPSPLEADGPVTIQASEAIRKNFSESEFALLRDYQARNDALSSIAKYTQWMKRSGLHFFDFDPAPFHLPIIAALEALERGDIQRLMITMPPGHGKSHWANIIFLSWIAAKHPHWGILSVSARLDLAIDFARKRRQILASPEWSLLSGVSPDPKLTAPEHIPYGPQGYMRAASVGQGIAGQAL